MATFTQTQYETLCAAIASGTKKVEYADKKVEYKSLKDMLAVKRLMEEDLGIGEFAPPATGRRRYADYHGAIN